MNALHHTILLAMILTPLAVLGLWVVLFRSPFLPHLTGKFLGVGMLKEEEFEQLLLVKGHYKLLQLWHCSFCQSVWQGLLGAVMLGGLSLFFSPYHALLTPLIWMALIPLFWVAQLPFGRNKSAIKPEIKKPQESPLYAPEGATIIRKNDGSLARVLTKEEQHVLSFFIDKPCDFEGCESLRAAYKQAVEEAGGEKCPDCKKGEIMREFREKLRVIYGYTKEQVPDLPKQYPAQDSGPA